LTWSRFDDAARKHPKATKAGNEAWAFWCASIMYSNQYGTDGFVPDSAIATDILPVAVKATKAKALADKLCEARLAPDSPALFSRDDARGGYQIHDFLEWNPSKADTDSKRRRDRDRKRGIQTDSARNPEGIQTDSEQNPDGLREDSASSCVSARVPTRAPAPVPARPVPPDQPGEENSPTPLDGVISESVPANGRRRTDRFMASMTGTASRNRPDVNELFDDWKALHGQPEARLCVGMWDGDADTLAEALDVYGPAKCKTVLAWSPNDGMVSGRDDEKRVKHNSIGYIFGNKNAFLRMLGAARAAEEAKQGGSFSSVIDRAKGIGA
jgi:hypothetical protein